MTIQTAVLIETLIALGAERALELVQHLLDPGPRRRGDRGASGIPVFAWKGETEEEYEWCIEQTMRGPERLDART